MWKDVVIGEGGMGATSVEVFKIKGGCSVSQNRQVYRVSGFCLDLGMTIYKDTKVGKALTQMIKDEECVDIIGAYLFRVAMEHIEKDHLIKKINKHARDYYNKGIEHIRMELRGVLGL